jgi:hypothetical protein
MTGTWSRSKTWIAGETLTAAHLNAEFDNVLAESDPDGIDDASTDTAAMRVELDPYGSSTEALATSLREEIQQLRYQIAEITGETYWYQDPNFAISDITSTYTELNLTDNMWASVTTTAVPAVGTCAVQFVFKDAAGTTMATPVAGTFYVSEVSTGLEVDTADTGVAVLTNGAVTIMDTGIASYYKFVTTAAGLLGITITANEDSYYIVFEHPTGKMVISTACAVNGA